MRCEDCQGGTGFRVQSVRSSLTAHYTYGVRSPCPSCGGTGQQSCCEGATGNARDVTNQGTEDG